MLRSRARDFVHNVSKPIRNRPNRTCFCHVCPSTLLNEQRTEKAFSLPNQQFIFFPKQMKRSPSPTRGPDRGSEHSSQRQCRQEAAGLGKARQGSHSTQRPRRCTFPRSSSPLELSRGFFSEENLGDSFEEVGEPRTASGEGVSTCSSLSIKGK